MQVAEELRRKHIATLEVLQKLVDENNVLKNSVDGNVLEQLSELRDQNQILLGSKTLLEKRYSEAEQRSITLAAELETLRILHQQQVGELGKGLRSLPSLDRPDEESKSQADAVAHERDEVLAEFKSQLTVARREIEAERTRALAAADSAAAEAAKAAALQNALDQVMHAPCAKCTEHSSLLDAQRNAIAEERLKTARQAERAQQATRVAGDRDIQLEKAAETILGLKRQNTSLENSLARIRADNTALQERLTSFLSQQDSTESKCLEVQPSEQDPSRFAEFVSLRRENQRLRRQLEDIKTSQSRTLNLTRRTTQPTGALALRRKYPG